MPKIEVTILKNLIVNADFVKQIFPYIKSEYFASVPEKTLFDMIGEYIRKYSKSPTMEIAKVEVENKKLDNHEFEEINTILEEIQTDLMPTDLQWLKDNTEKFCKDRALHNALLESIKIYDGRNDKLNTTAIPSILTQALGTSFDEHIGHDYWEDSDARFQYYHEKQNRMPWRLRYFNQITKGGRVSKSLTVILAVSGVGKTFFMCDDAAFCISQGKNVLYVSGEMSEQEISKRIDTNLMNINSEALMDLSEAEYKKRIEKIKANSGRLMVKEFPTGAASAADVERLLEELRIKKGFVPDIIYIDYLNVFVSVRYKPSNQNGMYTIMKAAAEEFRGVGVKYNVPIMTATQVNRSGYSSTDIDMENVSESMGIIHTADFSFALISSDELEELNQLLVKQLKNRYGCLFSPRKFIVGIDKSKMKFFDVADSVQNSIDQGVVVKQPTAAAKTKNAEVNSEGDSSTTKRNVQEFDGIMVDMDTGEELVEDLNTSEFVFST